MTDKPTGWSIAAALTEGYVLWSQNIENVRRLAVWLNRHNCFSNASAVIDFFSHPEKHTYQWCFYCQFHATTDRHLRSRLLEAMRDGIKTADEVLAEFQRERQSVESAARSEGAEHVGSVTTSG